MPLICNRIFLPASPESPDLKVRLGYFLFRYHFQPDLLQFSSVKSTAGEKSLN